jgi:hypothetical protein
MDVIVRMARVVRHLPGLIGAYLRVAQSPRDWEVVAREMERIHDWGLSSSDSRYRLGSAYVMLGRWHEAVSQLGLTDPSRLPERLEPRWRFNYSVALTRIGEVSRARDILLRDDGKWPADLVSRVQQIRREWDMKSTVS